MIVTHRKKEHTLLYKIIEVTLYNPGTSKHLSWKPKCRTCNAVKRVVSFILHIAFIINNYRVVHCLSLKKLGSNPSRWKVAVSWYLPIGQVGIPYLGGTNAKKKNSDNYYIIIQRNEKLPEFTVPVKGFVFCVFSLWVTHVSIFFIIS